MASPFSASLFSYLSVKVKHVMPFPYAAHVCAAKKRAKILQIFHIRKRTRKKKIFFSLLLVYMKKKQYFCALNTI